MPARTSAITGSIYASIHAAGKKAGRRDDPNLMSCAGLVAVMALANRRVLRRSMWRVVTFK
jgi:hypothetical protein